MKHLSIKYFLLKGTQDEQNDSNESKDENNEGQDYLYQNQLADPEIYAIYSRMTGCLCLFPEISGWFSIR